MSGPPPVLHKRLKLAPQPIPRPKRILCSGMPCNKFHPAARRLGCIPHAMRSQMREETCEDIYTPLVSVKYLHEYLGALYSLSIGGNVQAPPRLCSELPGEVQKKAGPLWRMASRSLPLELCILLGPALHQMHAAVDSLALCGALSRLQYIRCARPRA